MRVELLCVASDTFHFVGTVAGRVLFRLEVCGMDLKTFALLLRECSGQEMSADFVAAALNELTQH